MSNINITGLFIYPVKSMKAIPLAQAAASSPNVISPSWPWFIPA